MSLIEVLISRDMHIFLTYKGGCGDGDGLYLASGQPGSFSEDLLDLLPIPDASLLSFFKIS